MWNGTDWTVVGSQALGAIAVVSGVVAYFKKHFPKTTQTVENDILHSLPHNVATVVEDGAKAFEDIVASPVFAGLAAKGKVEAVHLIKEATDTKIGSEVKTILIGAGKLYSKMTQDEKVKAESALRLALNAIGIQLTDAEIQQKFTDVEKAISDCTTTPFFQALFGQPQLATDSTHAS